MILLDTHVVVWLALEPNKISKLAHAAITEARGKEQGLAISAITLWELTAAWRKGRVFLTFDLESFLDEMEMRFVVIPITARVCMHSRKIPDSYPKDPADRIIGATALSEAVPLITADREIQRSKLVPTIW